jgi:hypothetical protein
MIIRKSKYGDLALLAREVGCTDTETTKRQ